MHVNWTIWSGGTPTYGNYGGAGWTGGVRGGRDYSVPPVDALDDAFRTHDMGYGEADDVEATNPDLARQIRNDADARLLRDMAAIPDNELDFESRRYRDAAAAVFTAYPGIRDLLAKWPGGHPGRWDPLAVDLNADGLTLTPLQGSKAHFDFGGDGFAELTGWVGPRDGLLVWDRNGNGKIDNGLELFGSAVEDGFAALARQDGNGDGRIDAADAIFANLRVWRDVNGNGLTEAGELLTTEQAGIRTIDLAKTASGADNAGNRVDYTGTFTRTDGRTGVSAEISFAVNQTLARWTAPEGYAPSEEAQKLPILKGYGRLKDLAAAATTDAGLEVLQSLYVRKFVDF